MKNLRLAVAGKGGTGKTTFATFIVRYLLAKGKTPVLAVDADPNSNLSEALGMPVQQTISQVMEMTKEVDLPAGMSKADFIRYRVAASLVEGRDVDLLVMGNPEGPGCYCFPNDVLKGVLGQVVANYPAVVMDNEAGLEHLSRRIAQDIDVFFIMSDATARGIRSAGRAKHIIDSLATKVGRTYLIVTRVPNEGALRALEPEIEKTGLELIGWIPQDEVIVEYDVMGKPLLEVPADSAAWTAALEILEKSNI